MSFPGLMAALLLPLGIDTFVVAAVLGLTEARSGRDRLRITLAFAAFEAGLPVLGVVAGRLAGLFIGRWANLGAVLVVAAVGVMMLRSDDEAENARLGILSRARGMSLLALGLAISVDEFALGISAGLLHLPLLAVVLWLAVQAVVATQAGLRLGAAVSERLREGLEKVAGLALLALALGLGVEALRAG